MAGFGPRRFSHAGKPLTGNALNPKKHKNKKVFWCSHCDRPTDFSPCAVCGRQETLIAFDSKAERKRYAFLRIMETKKAIRGLRRQIGFPIIINTIKVGTYKADFIYFENGAMVVEDVKGFFTPLSKFKIKCVQAQYGVEVKIVK